MPKALTTLKIAVAMLLLCGWIGSGLEIVPVIIDIVIPACDTAGGILVSDQCVCKPGYTGPSCDVYLLGDEQNHATNYIGLKTFQRKIHYGRAGANDNKGNTFFHRVKRQADTMEGSGDESSSATESTESTTTTIGMSNCDPGEIFVNEECTYTNAFAVRITVDEDFSNAFSNVASAEAQNFIGGVSDEIETAMIGTSFLQLDVTSLSNGSVIIDGVIHFDQLEDLSTLEVNALLQSKLVQGIERILLAAAGDMNECNDDNICGANTTCMNTDGSFQCSCEIGFEETNSTSTSRRKNCRALCMDVECQNGGTCVAGESGTPFCSCSGNYGGPRCEASSLPWRQATIAVVVILTALLIAIVVLTAYYVSRRFEGKSRLSGFPLATGFRSASESPLKAFSAPYEVDDDDRMNSYSIEKDRDSKGRLSSSTKQLNGNNSNVINDDKL